MNSATATVVYDHWKHCTEPTSDHVICNEPSTQVHLHDADISVTVTACQGGPDGGCSWDLGIAFDGEFIEPPIWTDVPHAMRFAEAIITACSRVMQYGASEDVRISGGDRG